jgi:hypothetical protein
MNKKDRRKFKRGIEKSALNIKSTDSVGHLPQEQKGALGFARGALRFAALFALAIGNDNSKRPQFWY